MILANLVFYPEYLSARTESTTIQIDFRLARMRAVLFRSLSGGAGGARAGRRGAGGGARLPDLLRGLRVRPTVAHI